MIITPEMILAFISILSVLVGAVAYIGKRQSDARLKAAEAKASEAEARLTDAKTDLTKAQGDAAQQTGLIETLRELVRVNESSAALGREIVSAIQEAARQESENYRELRKQMDANTNYINSNVISLGDRVNMLRADLMTAIDRLPGLVNDANCDKAREMVVRLEQVHEMVAAMKAAPSPVVPLPHGEGGQVQAVIVVAPEGVVDETRPD